jgi:putative Holliday junction resolvase
MMRYLSIDLGLKRIGVAYSPDGNMVSPLKAIERKNRNQASKELKELLDEWSAESLVVGIPIGGSSEDEMRRRVAHFLNLVDFTGEIYYQDESDTSLEAEAMIKGEMKYRRDGRVDSIAAMIILKRYLKIL